MIRDYAPFQFRLTASAKRCSSTWPRCMSTTWDEKIGQAVREYADAFLDPKHPIGVWRSQDNSGPVHAEAPIMAPLLGPRTVALHARPRAIRACRKSFPPLFSTRVLGPTPFNEDLGVYFQRPHRLCLRPSPRTRGIFALPWPNWKRFATQRGSP